MKLTTLADLDQLIGELTREIERRGGRARVEHDPDSDFWNVCVENSLAYDSFYLTDGNADFDPAAIACDLLDRARRHDKEAAIEDKCECWRYYVEAEQYQKWVDSPAGQAAIHEIIAAPDDWSYRTRDKTFRGDDAAYVHFGIEKK
jgi:hypothetical protein